MKPPASRIRLDHWAAWLTQRRIEYAAAALVVIGLSYWMVSSQSARIDALILENHQQAATVENLAAEIAHLQSSQETTTADHQKRLVDQGIRDNGAESIVRQQLTLLSARLNAIEKQPPPAVAPSPTVVTALADQAAAIKALDIDTRALAGEIDTLNQALAAAAAEEASKIAAIQSEAAEFKARQAIAPSNAPGGQARQEQHVILAFQTLDQQFQSILKRMEILSAKDQALEQAQEASMVALQTELDQWREQRSPPLWGMAAQLSGVTIRFSESTNLADGASAQSALQQVSMLLLEADPSIGVRIVGYADFDGTDPVSNRIISQKRADFILDQLTRLGVPQERMLAVGRATEDRVINSDSEGNANRRAIFEPFLLKDTSG